MADEVDTAGRFSTTQRKARMIDDLPWSDAPAMAFTPGANSSLVRRWAWKLRMNIDLIIVFASSCIYHEQEKCG